MLKAILLITLFGKQGLAQKIVDPCFASIKEYGFYYGSEDIQNVCDCSNRYLASDLIEWDGSQWIGVVLFGNVTLPPPEGCSNRAIWMGYEFWTRNGEAVGLKLDGPLVAGKTYSYTFTYASDGTGNEGNFSPLIYTHQGPVNERSVFRTGYHVGRLPETDGWSTSTLSFMATEQQNGHTWLILHAKESSGLILSDCRLDNINQNFLGPDQLICEDESITLKAPTGKYYNYLWNTGNKSDNETVFDAGTYMVQVSYHHCEVEDTIVVATENCEVILEMPNVFTPNGDRFNNHFVPKTWNYIESGMMRIFNRWGNEIFIGELFSGWDGKAGNSESATGVYYYEVNFIDRKHTPHYLRGSLYSNAVGFLTFLVT